MTDRLAALIRFSVIAALALTGCRTAAPESVLERNKQLVRQMNDEVWNQGNFESVEEFHSTGFVRYFLPDGSELRGIEALQDHVQEHREAFPDWKEEIRHMVAEGDLVVIHFVSTGTNTGSWRGFPPTGKKIEIHEVSILRIEDGKITTQWLMPDLFSLRQQLGLADPSQRSSGASSPD